MIAVMVFLFLLPLTALPRLTLCALLGLIGAVLWRQRSIDPGIECLYLDTDNWKIAIGNPDTELSSERVADPTNVRAEYLSAWLLMLSYEYDGRRYRLPVFRSMTSGDDFIRLSALVRLMNGRG